MKVVIAPDSFKGNMTSYEAGMIIAEALRPSLPAAKLVVIPVADGGEGTTDAVVRATGGTIHEVTVTGPLGDPVTACFGLLPDARTAVMEMASASGIELVAEDRLDPMRATTFGTGELIRAALERGVRELIIGIGGSATVDGGIGLAQALGYRLRDCNGTEVNRGGQALATVVTIDSSGALPALAEARIRVACDVTNPLLGAAGAARVFAPQKGATPEMVEALESGLGNLARVWQQAGLLDSVDSPGDGAAGGLGAGLRAFCRAELCSGAGLVAELSGFDREIQDAQILITGEGRTDEQTAGGKLCSVLAAKAHTADTRTILVSGTIEGDLKRLEGCYDAVFACVPDVMSRNEAIARGRETLSATVRSIGRVLALATKRVSA
jgi:glycerate kinase